MRKKYQQFHSATMKAFKIAFVMLFLLSNCAIVMAQSPNKKISVTCKNEPLASALKKVEKASGYKVLFTYDEVQNYKVTISAKGQEVNLVLKTIFDKLPFDYKFKGKYINVSKREKRILNISDGADKGDHIVRGVVFDVHGSPIPGVLITVVGKHRGTTTNVEGVFGLDLQSPKALVEFSFIGMKKKRVTLTSQSAYVKVTLEDESHELGETVITGYRNVNKNSYTGSSTQILGDDLRKVSQTNILDAIQSFDPSFRIMDNTQFGSDPNAMPEMTIRGQSGVGNRALDTDQLSKSNLKNNPNLPTFIMDGFEVSIEKIYDLDPTRIESITILKDAAATAIYGSRAANGVVVVTTVAPKPGEVRVSYGFTGTLETPDLRDYNLANASEKLEIERRAGYFEKNGPSTNNITSEADGVNAYNTKLALIKRGIDTDWLSIPLRNGFCLNREDMLKQISEAFNSGNYNASLSLLLEEVEPEGDVNTLIDSMRELSRFSTEFATSNESRSRNVQKAAGLLNCVILEPGEELSYNELLGPRTEELGWLPAHGISGGKEYIDTPGGGICQVSSTLYNSLLLIGPDIRIVSRSHHSIPGSYVAMGLDATVSYYGPDLVWSNASESPMFLFAYADMRTKTVYTFVYGTQPDDGTHYKIWSDTIEKLDPPEPKRIAEPLWPTGYSKMVISPRYGYIVEVYRQLIGADGQPAGDVEKLYTDKYVPVQGELHYGTGSSTLPVPNR